MKFSVKREPGGGRKIYGSKIKCGVPALATCSTVSAKSSEDLTCCKEFESDEPFYTQTLVVALPPSFPVY